MDFWSRKFFKCFFKNYERTWSWWDLFNFLLYSLNFSSRWNLLYICSIAYSSLINTFGGTTWFNCFSDNECNSFHLSKNVDYNITLSFEMVCNFRLCSIQNVEFFNWILQNFINAFFFIIMNFNLLHRRKL